MTELRIHREDPPPLERLTPERRADLEAVLAAWQDATSRLQQTHESLRGEVRRLTDELEKKNRELARKNRLADLGQISTHVAHEVRNSLVPVTLYLSLLRRRLAQDSASLEVLDKMDSSFSDVRSTVNDLLHFAADRDPVRRQLRIRDLVEDVRISLAPQLMAQGIRFAIDVPPEQFVLVDRDMLRRAVLNLAMNALDVMPDGGEIVVTSFIGARGFELEIADSGPGLDEETTRRAFEPFYTTKSSGTGLGLAIVSRIAELHGGDVTVINCPEGGAAFTLRIPHRAMEAAA
ncbi:MAG: sensor histidine kinase [Pirellulales bacterium]|nr:sensor histidine kinase [Pirellulales bacterium]